MQVAAGGGCAAANASNASALEHDVYFKARAGGNDDPRWASWTKPHGAPAKFATGPPAGLVLPSGRIAVAYYTMGQGGHASALLSDDGGATFWPSRGCSLAGGGEGTLALAPNGSLLFNTRATKNDRFQSASDDGGATCSAPRTLQGFGSSADGALLRLGSGSSGTLLFSHSNDINGTASRWNMTVWRSADSGASWTPIVQVEPDGNITLHTAYSALAELTPSSALVLWERGPMGGRCTPAYPGCSPIAGEYQSLRARRFDVPVKGASVRVSF